MKLYLASFLQPENFGPGRLIGICKGKRPSHLEVNLKFDPFIPSLEISNKYYEEKNTNPNAGPEFAGAYKKQLIEFLTDVKKQAEEKNMSIAEFLEFQDGDTFASWERAENSNYRRTLGDVLEDFGFEVSLK